MGGTISIIAAYRRTQAYLAWRDSRLYHRARALRAKRRRAKTRAHATDWPLSAACSSGVPSLSDPLPVRLWRMAIALNNAL